MPIVSGSKVTPPPVNPPARPLDVPRGWWIDPSGRTWYLNDITSGWATVEGVKGLGAIPVTLSSTDQARGGAIVRHIQRGPRLVTWPMLIVGDNHTQFVDRWRRLSDAFEQTDELASGTLVVARPDGSTRQIRAFYQEGFDDSGDGSRVDDHVVLTLYCPDPAFTATKQTVISRSFGESLDFLNPYPSVSSSQTLGDTTVTNSGQLEVWPEWTITGPASQVTATNHTTGGEWVLDPTAVTGDPLPAGATVTVVGAPPRITGPDGSSWNLALDWAHSDLWPLVPGDNAVTFTVAGSGPGTTIAMRFAARYRGA